MRGPMVSLERLFRPRSVAVVGASKTPGKIGHAVLVNLVASGFRGAIYPINPKEEEIEGLKAYPRVADVPGPVDVAVICVPAPAVNAVAEECGRAGVGYLVVITAGFKETGKEGAEREKALAAICRQYGMRMVGPNCLGIMDTSTPMNATFSANFPFQGRIAFISQSGALCAAILDWSLKRGIGFSKFISVGNKADLTEADFIEDAAADPQSKVICLYLESVEEGARFVEACRRASRTTPILVIKSGTSQAGAQAASSHTGALAGSDLAYETAFRQAGVLRVHTMEELFDLAQAFVRQPAPPGNRVAIVTNSGGPGVLAADAIENSPLTMARFEKETIDRLRKSLPAAANVFNPVDVIGDAHWDRYDAALAAVLDDPGVDGVLVVLTPTATIEPDVVAEKIVEHHRRHPEKPVLAAFLGGASVEEATRYLLGNGIPCYPFPEPAVSALAGLLRYRELSTAPAAEEEWTFPDVDRAAVEEVFSYVRRDKRVVLLGSEAFRVAESYGIPCAPSYLATTPDAARRLAEHMGFPVVLKVASPQILHKTDVGGVKVGLATPEEVKRGFVDIMESVHQHLPDSVVYGVEVQKMMPPGRELIVGVTRDVQFGPLIMFGLGGVYVNLLKDVAFRLAHGLTREEAHAMIRQTRAYTLLRGFRGERPADIEAIVDTIGRVAQLVRDFPEITEMDINPVFAYEKGLAALDVKITIR